MSSTPMRLSTTNFEQQQHFDAGKYISWNNSGVECIQNEQFQEAIDCLDQAYLSLLGDSNSNEREGPTATTTAPQPHLFDIDPLLNIPTAGNNDPANIENSADTTQNEMMIYRHPIRIPSLLAELNNDRTILEGLVKISIVFNLALAYHLNSTSCHSMQQQHQQLQQAYGMYKSAIQSLPSCVETSKAIFQLAVLTNLANIANKFGQIHKRKAHLEDVVSIVVYMTSRNNGKNGCQEYYEYFFAPASIQLLATVGRDNENEEEEDDKLVTSSSTSKKTTKMFYSAVA